MRAFRSLGRAFRIAPATPATWRDFARYLRHPRPLAPSGLRAPGVARSWLAMAVLQWLGTVPLLALVDTWRRYAGFAAPTTLQGMHGGWRLLVAALAAPVIEESLFRGWLTGRPRALWLLAVALATAVAFRTPGLGHPALARALLSVGLVAAVAGWLALRRHHRSLIAPIFAPLFYVAALLFAAAHVANYHAAWWLVLPMVLPQLWLGLIAGYLRLRIGLPAAMLLHATNNGILVLLYAAAHGWT